MLTNFFRCHINTLLLEIDGLSKKKKKKLHLQEKKKSVLCQFAFLTHGKVDPSQGIPGSVRLLSAHALLFKVV